MQSTQTTVEVKIKDKSLYPVLERYARFHTHLEMMLFNDLVNAPAINPDLRKQLKRDYIARHGIHARMFNALWCGVIGKINSLKALHELDVKDAKAKSKSLQSKLSKLEKSLKAKRVVVDVKKTRQDIYYTKRKLTRLANKLMDDHKPSMVFGTKKLYRQQWTVYKDDHDTWLDKWRNNRLNHFSFVGSKSEPNGNQMCQYKNHALYITMPYCFKDIRHIIVPVDFNSTDQRRQEKYYKYFQDAVESGQALSYKFLKRDNGYWYVQCSFELSCEPATTNNGTIGVDFNHNNIVESYVDFQGNFKGFNQNKFDLEGKTTEQIKQITSKVVNTIVADAVKMNKSITIEDLDLDKCKSGNNKTSNHKISAMQYADFRSQLLSKCVKEKVKLIVVNPAYTSVIGDYKYSRRFGVNRHTAAAYVIGRRGLNLKDKLTSQLAHVLRWGEDDGFEKIHLRGHHWKHWAFVCKNLGKSLYKYNSGSGRKAIDVNTLKSRFNPCPCVVGDKVELVDSESIYF